MGPGLPIHGQHIWVLFLQNIRSRPCTLHPVETDDTCAENGGKEHPLYAIVQIPLRFGSA